MLNKGHTKIYPQLIFKPKLVLPKRSFLFIAEVDSRQLLHN